MYTTGCYHGAEVVIPECIERVIITTVGRRNSVIPYNPGCRKKCGSSSTDAQKKDYLKTDLVVDTTMVVGDHLHLDFMEFSFSI
jgi:hypothetical protein